jgi:hypothetical protein
VRLSGLLGKKWLIPLLVILIIILAIETTILVIVVGEMLGGRQFFPGISLYRFVGPGCPTLVWSVESSNSSNRSILFTCPTVSGNPRGALMVRGNPFDFSCAFSKDPCYPAFGAVPTFSLPQGYRALSLTPQSCASSTQFIPLKSGGEILVVGYPTGYNYCAIVDNSVSKVDGFTINWSNGRSPVVLPTPFTLSVYPTSETVPAGGIANYTLTVTSLNGWTGNVTVGLRGGYTLGIGYNVSPPVLVLQTGGSYISTLRQPTCTSNRTYCAPLGLNNILVEASTSCPPAFPGGGCIDSYKEADVNVKVNIV